MSFFAYLDKNLFNNWNWLLSKKFNFFYVKIIFYTILILLELLLLIYMQSQIPFSFIFLGYKISVIKTFNGISIYFTALN